MSGRITLVSSPSSKNSPSRQKLNQAQKCHVETENVVRKAQAAKGNMRGVCLEKLNQRKGHNRVQKQASCNGAARQGTPSR